VTRVRILFSDAAVADVLEQADWYEAQSGQRLAKTWQKSVTDALLRIVESPLSGNLCTFEQSELRDVRRTPIKGFPKHLVFYRFRDGELRILRIAHGARDLESLF
jgi:plasmid stabilization system protein ParE